MTTTLSLDPETERLAQKVALAKGKPIDAIVRDAIEASAREAGIAVTKASRLTPAEKRQRLLEISERSAARPVLDARSADEILGFDDRGLPR
ncbi:MAG: type II toxin-antitoxin system VapB family antitoxin [Gammaproteobacteria bacterium]|jgi:antitoxin VapB|nr:type II toxin-antitoxin system VapB family antitoxin [Gammaproteobacteria bacterium]